MIDISWPHFEVIGEGKVAFNAIIVRQESGVPTFYKVQGIGRDVTEALDDATEKMFAFQKKHTGDSDE